MQQRGAVPGSELQTHTSSCRADPARGSSGFPRSCASRPDSHFRFSGERRTPLHAGPGFTTVLLLLGLPPPKTGISTADCLQPHQLHSTKQLLREGGSHLLCLPLNTGVPD